MDDHTLEKNSQRIKGSVVYTNKGVKIEQLIQGCVKRKIQESDNKLEISLEYWEHA